MPTARTTSSAIRSCSRRARRRSTCSSPARAGLDGRQREDIGAFAAEYRRNGQGAVHGADAGRRAHRWRRAPARSTPLNARRSRSAGLPRGLPRGLDLSVVDPVRRLADPALLPAAHGQGRPATAALWPHDLGVSDIRDGIRQRHLTGISAAPCSANVAAQVADPVDLVRARRTEGRSDHDPPRQGHRRPCARARIRRRSTGDEEGTKINPGSGMTCREANGLASERRPRAATLIAPVPRITIQAFCETPEVAASIEAAADDRRMQKAHVKVQMGGAPAAVEAYRQAPTPNVIVLESTRRSRARSSATSISLAEVCDGGTKVDRRRTRQRRRALSRADAPRRQRVPHRSRRGARRRARRSRTCSRSAGAAPVGRTIAVVGAKGGVGASTVAHNLGWAIARQAANSRPWSSISTSLSAPPGSTSTRIRRRASLRRSSRPTGSTPTSSIACCRSAATISAFSPRRRCSIARPISSETALDGLIDILRASIPASSSTCRTSGRPGRKRTLIGADEIVIVAAPELAIAAQRQEPVRHAATRPAQRPRAQGGAQSGRRAEAARDRRSRVRARRSGPTSDRGRAVRRAAVRHGGE